MADIAIVLKDLFSGKLNSITNANKGLSKSMEETQKKVENYSKKLNSLSSNLAKQQTELQKVSKELKDAKKAFDECADAANNDALTEAHKKYNDLQNSIADTKRSARETRAELRKLNDDAARMNSEQSRADRGTGAGSTSVVAVLAQAGVLKQFWDAAGELGGSLAHSWFGNTAGNYATNIVGGTATGIAAGAMAGSILGLPGAAVGAAVGAISGLVKGIAQDISSKDDAFRSAAQENYDNAVAWRDNLKDGGSATAAQREMDRISFDTLLEGGGDAFLTDLIAKAAETPMEYSDLVSLAKTLATAFGHTPGDDSDVDIMGLIDAIGNAGAAVGLDASGLSSVATAMTRMKSTGKVTLEYLNLMTERGVNAVGLLAEGLGKSTDDVYAMISKGQLKGAEAVAILEEQMMAAYGGAMGRQAATFSGRQSTLSDLETDIGNAYGEAYNEEKGKGINSQIAFYENPKLGAAIKEAYAQMGEWEASVENLEQDLTNAALEAVLTGVLPKEFAEYFDDAITKSLMELHEEYGSDENADGSETGRILAAAKANAYAAYTQTDAYDTITASELELIRGVQEATQDSYWKAGWKAAEQWSLGHLACFDAMSEQLEAGTPGGYGVIVTNEDGTRYYSDKFGMMKLPPHAYGLNRVPYDGYRAVLHEGERVLTANQARQMDGSLPASGVVITGNSFTVREEADIDRIAEALVRELTAAKYTYAG